MFSSKYFFNCSGVTPWVIVPSFTYDIAPVCSETITDMASDISVTPMAERWRRPRLGLMAELDDTGSIHLAAIILLPFTITAPSCNGVFLKKIVLKNYLQN